MIQKLVDSWKVWRRKISQTVKKLGDKITEFDEPVEVLNNAIENGGIGYMDGDNPVKIDSKFIDGSGGAENFFVTIEGGSDNPFTFDVSSDEIRDAISAGKNVIVDASIYRLVEGQPGPINVSMNRVVSNVVTGYVFAGYSDDGKYTSLSLSLPEGDDPVVLDFRDCDGNNFKPFINFIYIVCLNAITGEQLDIIDYTVYAYIGETIEITPPPIEGYTPMPPKVTYTANFDERQVVATYFAN